MIALDNQLLVLFYNYRNYKCDFITCVLHSTRCDQLNDLLILLFRLFQSPPPVGIPPLTSIIHETSSFGNRVGVGIGIGIGIFQESKES